MGAESVEEASPGGHSFRTTADKPRNGACLVPGCGLSRYAKPHAGYKPQYEEVPPSTAFVGVVEDAEESKLPDPAVPDTLADVRRVLDDCLELVVVKNSAYGDAWKDQGYMGNLARIMSKHSRLRNMVWGDTLEDLDTEETVEDTLLDMINLCAFMILNWQEDNRWGK